jgi:hypothetical protein
VDQQQHNSLGVTMTTAEPLGFAEPKSSEPEVAGTIHKLPRSGAAFRQAESGGEMSAEKLGTLLHQLSKPSMGEIDNLVSELQTLRRKLENDGNRIEREIAEYGALSQQVMQLTKIIFESVKKLPVASSVSR